TQGAALEATHRTDTAGKVVLIERHDISAAETTGKAGIGVQAQGPVLGDREEALTTVADIVEVQVTARDGGFQPQTLGVTAIREDAAVEGGLRPADVGLDAEEAVAFGFEEVEDLFDGVDPFLDLVLLHAEAEGQTGGIADRIADVEAGTVGVHRVAGDVHVQLVIVGGAVEGVVAHAHAIGREVGIEE